MPHLVSLFELVNFAALCLGWAFMAIGGLIILGIAAWAAFELWWRQIRVAGLLTDIYHWRLAGRPHVRPQVLAKKGSAHD